MITSLRSRDNNAGRATVLLLLSVLLVSLLSAQEVLTPANLDTWAVRGNPLVVDLAQNRITVPIGGELSRSFTADGLAVHLVSHPYFSPELTALPALTVGPATLTFSRDQAGGALVLLGDQALSLPFAITLDNAGRSQQALDFTLGYNQPQSTATLSLSGRLFRLPATAPNGLIEVVVTAGASAPWPLDTLEVSTTPGAKPDSAAMPGLGSGTSAKTDSALTAAEAARKRAAIADAVMRGELTPAQALEKLRQGGYYAGKIDAEAAFALAAIQIGETLVANVRFALAEPFFRAAEPSLLLAKGRATKPKFQALLLKQLAWIRSHYLQQQAQAKTDIQSAYQLNPEDRNLQQLRRRLTAQGLEAR